MSLELHQCRHENPAGNIEEVTLLCTNLLVRFSFALLLYFSAVLNYKIIKSGSKVNGCERAGWYKSRIGSTRIADLNKNDNNCCVLRSWIGAILI